MGERGGSTLPDIAIANFLQGSGLAATPSATSLTPLTGGIASDIWKVETPDRCFVIKRALPRLRVAQEWTAPVSRNANEADWMLVAERTAPSAVPRILARDTEAGIFAMTYLDPAQYPVWKQELRAGRVNPAFAAQVGKTIAAIHAATAGSADLARRFANEGTFYSLRIEPYLEATARCHPDLAEPLLQLARDTLCSKRALVHGDVSPKNILVGPSGPVFLDAECAWFGEPAFDLAFCLNHLLLKCVWMPFSREAFLASFDALAKSYLASVRWEPSDDIEARAARLLPALLLARIDGKSPVEYIQEEDAKNFVRQVARPLIARPPLRLAAIRDVWEREISA
jgi:aminoglycoside phosphotransferase (APT) family kinase protein